MSRIDQAGPVSKILHYLFECFVKFSMCSYERAGWLGSRDVGFFIRENGQLVSFEEALSSLGTIDRFVII